jgi:hypothetical protein
MTMTFGKILVAVLVAMMVVVAANPLLATNTSPNDQYAGSNGRYGSIGTAHALVVGGFHPYHGPDTWEGCRQKLSADGFLRSDNRPW